MNRNLRFIHGYTYCVAENELITWVSISIWNMFLSEFPQSNKNNPCPRTIIYNTCKKMNVSDDILNTGGNFFDQDYYGFTGSLFKISTIIIY